MEGISIWMSSQAADSFNTGIQNLLSDATLASIAAVTKHSAALSILTRLYIIKCFFTFLIALCYFLARFSPSSLPE